MNQKRLLKDSFAKRLIVCAQTFIANVCWLIIVAIHMVGKFFYFLGVMIRFWQTFGQTGSQTFGLFLETFAGDGERMGIRLGGI